MRKRPNIKYNLIETTLFARKVYTFRERLMKNNANEVFFNTDKELKWQSFGILMIWFAFCLTYFQQ